MGNIITGVLQDKDTRRLLIQFTYTKGSSERKTVLKLQEVRFTLSSNFMDTQMNVVEVNECNI